MALGAALVVAGIILLGQGRSEAAAHQSFVEDNLVHDYAQTLGVELDRGRRVNPHPDGKAKITAGSLLAAAGTLGMAGGIFMTYRPQSRTRAQPTTRSVAPMAPIITPTGSATSDAPRGRSHSVVASPADALGSTPGPVGAPPGRAHTTPPPPPADPVSGGAASAETPISRYPCPYCGESISTLAKLCRFCRSDLSSHT